MKKCPLCGNHSVEYSQNADILFEIDGDRLVAKLDIESIGFLDSTYLYCRECVANDSDDPEMSELKDKYDALMIRK